MSQVKKDIGVYIHVPFCKSKCFYCDFNSYACAESSIPEYFSAVKKEMGLYTDSLKELEIGTVFIGGGTPSYVAPEYLNETLNLLRTYGHIQAEAEISIETNPGTLSYDKLAAYRDMGINRLSIGLQAWQEPILKSIGRIHSRGEFLENYRQARKAGFENINVDLIFGLPGQTLAQWEETIHQVLSLQPEHISCYSLKVEEGTLFGERLEAGELKMIEDELDREMYYLAVEKLKKAGLKHYEISNFARPGYECRHNLIYWKAEEYIGIGAGAHSYFDENRYSSYNDIKDYVEQLKNGLLPQENKEFISKTESISEYIILGLRLIKGVRSSDFQARYNEDLFHLYKETIGKLQGRGLLQADEKGIRLTPKGLDLANEVMAEFI